MNIIDYVHKYGELTFHEEPFNEVDSLVLCQLAYLDFGKYVPGLDKRNAPVTIKSIYEDADWPVILESYWFKESNSSLFTAVVESKRFGDLKLNYYVNMIDEDKEMQFCAITYVLGDKNCYLAYRGTDATLVGWKEDANMALSGPVSSHQLSCEYMNRVAGYIAGCFYAGGHSKGGNLAAYAAMNCSEHTREKLLALYNNDGPGFLPEILEVGNYEAIRERTVKLIPRSSVVGVLLESEVDYEVVESRSFGVFQHNAFNWRIADTSFVRAGKRDDFAKFRDAAFNEWIFSLSEEEKHALIDSLYQVLSASKVKDLFQMVADWPGCMQSMSAALRDMNEETRRAILRIFRAGFEIAGDMAIAEMRDRQQEMKEKQQEMKLRQQEMKLRHQEIIQEFREKTQEFWKNKTVFSKSEKKQLTDGEKTDKI